ncbi:MAG: hypothetical protein CMI16_12560 [Opitutaceae bacterium]|nr:hypothetical protein [Opitutaceae bacterium]
MSRDYFHYPDPKEFRAIVEKFNFPDPSRWRHPLAVIHKRDGVTHRLTIKGLEFPGRCFHCKRNNKSASFCFFGQGARDGRAVDDLPVSMVRKLEKIAMCVRLRDDDVDEGATTTTRDDDSPLVFPHESEYEDMSSTVALERVSQQHGFPPVIALLCQPAPSRFREFFPASLFDDFLGNRVVFELAESERATSPVVIAGAIETAWRESDESLAERRRVLAEVSGLDDDARRVGVAGLMKQSYLVFTRFDCADNCSTPSRACATCRRVRARAKKYYLDEVRRVVVEHVGGLFDRREGPFAKCPARLSNACWDDDACQVDRLVVRADAKPKPKTTNKRKRRY